MSQSPFWNEDWMSLQKNYWEQWNDFSRKAAGMAAPSKSPWEQAMEHWWQAISPQQKNPAADFMEKMMEQGKQFFRMTEEIQKGVEQQKDWSANLNDTFEKLRAQLHESTQAASDNFNKGLAFWQSPVETWQQFAGKAMPFNPEATRGLDMFGQILGAPGLGYSREMEEQYKKLMQAGVNYQTALCEYNETLADIGPLSLDVLKNKILAMKENGKSIDSARQLYDLWVASSEEVYAERVMTKEYIEVHGGLVNALMAFKTQWHDILDNRLGALGMPTQREMHTIQDRLQESRREVRAMRSEMNALKKQMAELVEKQNQPAPVVEEKPVAKKAVAKKTAAKKTVTKKKAAQKKTAPKNTTGKKATPKAAAE